MSLKYLTKYKHISIYYEEPPKNKSYFITEHDIVDTLKSLPQEHLSDIQNIELRRISQAAREKSSYLGRYVTSRNSIKIFPTPKLSKKQMTVINEDDMKRYKIDTLVHEIGHHHGEKLSGKKDISEQYAECYVNAWREGKKDIRKFKVKEQQCLL